MKQTMIEFRDVCYTYDSEDEKDNPVLEQVNVAIEKGEFVAVLGHNGSGKSTFAKLCNGILIPQQGRVTVDGMDTADEEKLFAIRKKVGMVFQNPDNQIVATIVEDDVAFGPENLGVPPSEIRMRVDDALKSVGMYEYRLREPHMLSGGQKQRVAIAGILAMRTDAVVLDEPTAMLDPAGRKEVMAAVLKLNREMEKTVIFITHFMQEAVLADRVLVINDGKLIKQGTPMQVFSDCFGLRKIGLDVPVSMQLCSLLRQKGISVSDTLDMDTFVNECLAQIGKGN